MLVEREWEWGLKVGCRLELNFCTVPLPIPLYILVLLHCNYFFTGIGVFSRILGPEVHPEEGGGPAWTIHFVLTMMCEAHALEALLTLVSVPSGTVGRGHITTVILDLDVRQHTGGAVYSVIVHVCAEMYSHH